MPFFIFVIAVAVWIAIAIKHDDAACAALGLQRASYSSYCYNDQGQMFVSK
jgi:hypothetical protein